MPFNACFWENDINCQDGYDVPSFSDRGNFRISVRYIAYKFVKYRDQCHGFHLGKCFDRVLYQCDY